MGISFQSLYGYPVPGVGWWWLRWADLNSNTSTLRHSTTCTDCTRSTSMISEPRLGPSTIDNTLWRLVLSDGFMGSPAEQGQNAPISTEVFTWFASLTIWLITQIYIFWIHYCDCSTLHSACVRKQALLCDDGPSFCFHQGCHTKFSFLIPRSGHVDFNTSRISFCHKSQQTNCSGSGFQQQFQSVVLRNLSIWNTGNNALTKAHRMTARGRAISLTQHENPSAATLKKT